MVSEWVSHARVMVFTAMAVGRDCGGVIGVLIY